LNGFYLNEENDFDGSQQTYPKLFQAEDYKTAVIGKWHLGSKPTGFDHWDILPGQGFYYNPLFINENGTQKTEGYVTDIITDKAIEWLEQNIDKDSAFFLQIGHKAPHATWQPALEYLGYYDNVTFPVPETLFDDYSGRGSAAREQDMSISKSMKPDAYLKMWDSTSITRGYQYTSGIGRLNPEQLEKWNAYYKPVKEEYKRANLQGEELILWKYQRYMHEYHTTVLSVDKSVGRVLDYLKEKGLDKNTIVVYASDQGFYLGEHGWFDKRFMYEESYRTPLLISWPGVTKPGSVNSDIVSNLDFAQTFLDAIGAEQPADMQGASLVPLLKGKTPEDWRKEHYYHFYAYPDFNSVKRHYGISDARYKLMHFYYDIDEWEMYDLVKDPNELRNIYHDPEYAEVREDLHRRLEKIREKYGDSDELTRSFLPKE
jgi:arylsulfatase A-like enzyme